MATPTTLPAAFVAGAILTAEQQNNLRGAFRVLQVVGATYGTAVSNSTSTDADTGLTATITCQSTSSKVLVLVSQAGCSKSAGNLNNAMRLSLVRNGSLQLYMVDGGGYTATAMVNIFGTVSLAWLDSPGSTSAQTYKTTFSNIGIGAASVSVQSVFNNSPTSTMTLMEISA